MLGVSRAVGGGEGLLKPPVLRDHGRVHAVLVKKKHRFLEQGDCGVPGRPVSAAPAWATLHVEGALCRQVGKPWLSWVSCWVGVVPCPGGYLAVGPSHGVGNRRFTCLLF